MLALLDRLPFSRQLVLYVLAISVARGLFFPDFRFDLISVFVIQLVYPLALALPIAMRAHAGRFWSHCFLCLLGLVVSAGLSLLVYLLVAGIEHLMDRVSIPIFLLSFIAQLILVSLIMAVAAIAARIRANA